MDTAHDFETRHRPNWDRLAQDIQRLSSRRQAQGLSEAAETLVQNYRAACDHLALARVRAYPPHLVQELEALTEQAHALIYRPEAFNLERLIRLMAAELPQRIRAMSGPMWLSFFALVVPGLALGLACWWDPGFALTVLPAEQLQQFESMYSEGQQRLGRRDAQDDWQMFGFYIMHNIGIAFQCFASGLLAGLGSLYFLVLNGVIMGAVAGFLTARDHGLSFYSFVATHGAFELTAIVLAGGAGLHIGRALLWPGRHRRSQALALAAQEAVWPMGLATWWLVLAAGLEAFWSALGAVPPSIKFSVAGLCWVMVLSYLFAAGRTKVSP